MAAPRPWKWKIVSGGQTGADRAAFDTALSLGLEIGGWVPRGRRAEDGRIPDRYTGLRETDSDEYAVRTEWNVRDTDSTLILGFGPLSGGTELTRELAARMGRPHLVLDLERADPDEAAETIRAWLGERETPVLNVAGPRESEAPGIGAACRAVLTKALANGPVEPALTARRARRAGSRC